MKYVLMDFKVLCVFEVVDLHLLKEDESQDGVRAKARVRGSPALEQRNGTLVLDDPEEAIHGALWLNQIIIIITQLNGAILKKRKKRKERKEAHLVLFSLGVHDAGLDDVKRRTNSGRHQTCQQTGGEVRGHIVLEKALQ